MWERYKTRKKVKRKNVKRDRGIDIVEKRNEVFFFKSWKHFPVKEMNTRERREKYEMSC